MIYEGNLPTDCSIDSYGNLYFVESVTSSLNSVSYLDLFSGFKNKHYTIYEADEEQTDINTPVGIEVVDSTDAYFVNGVSGTVAGTLNKANLLVEYVNEEEIQVIKKHVAIARGVTYSDDDYIYYSLDNGEIWGIEAGADDDEAFLKSTEFYALPSGICYSDGTVYVADYDLGGIWSIDNDAD